jgi:hypothetical protein
MLSDSDNDARFFAAAAGFTPANWRGAVLYESRDGGVNYTAIKTLSAAATMGYTTDILGDFASGNIPDESNTVNVDLLDGELSSTTTAGLLAGTNTCVIGDEIIYFRTATLEVDGSYTLSGLLRGRRGTEYAMGAHAIGDRFVLVTSATVARIGQVTADIGATRHYKAVSNGSTLADAEEIEFTNDGATLEPYAPVHLGGGRDASGNLTINWTRRNRISGEWRDSVDVPMSETSEAYEVDIYSDGTYSTVLRTVTGLSSATTPYSAADQTTDFGSPQSTVYFRVYQMSSIVGRGRAASGSA